MGKLSALTNFVKTRWFAKIKTKEKLTAYQLKMLKRQLAFLKEKSPYFKAMNPQKLSDIPIMDKAVMMENFNALNTVGIDRDKALALAIESERTRDFTPKYGKISVGLSSGTSGHRGLFVISDRERNEWAGTILAKLLPKGHILGHRVAFFLRADNNLYETMNSAALSFSFFDLLKPMEEHFKTLKEFQPTILVAPASVLKEIAKKQEESEFIQPEKIISVAEVLNEADERYIKKAFRKDIIHQVYQCTEGFLGYTCECGKMHLNEDVIYVEKEYVSENRFVPVITDFRRKTQPIIRYRLNDILVESEEKCKCGSPFLAIDKIEGREDDVFLLNGPDGEVKVFADFISRCMVYVEDIENYRVVQLSADEIVIYIDQITDRTKEDTIGEFKRLSEKMNFFLPKISFAPYETTPGKKVKRVERLYKRD